MKKALIITYYWPPAGGPGVQRILKFVKYLPQYGWEPMILTVDNGEYPARDETLIKEIPKNIKVFHSHARDYSGLYRRFSGMKKDQVIPVAVLSQKDLSLKKRFAKWVRLNFVIPDAKKGWKKDGIKTGQKIIDRERPDVIFSSSPPPTVHTIAKKLSQKNKIPWVADLRDPWSRIHYYLNNRSVLTNRLDARLERKTLEGAISVTTVSKHFGKLIDVDKEKLKIIPNGYDPDDLSFADVKADNTQRFSIAYVGGMNENRFYPEFFESLKAFAKENKLTAEDISLTIAGKIPESYLKHIKSIINNDVQLNVKGYLSHPDAVALMRSSAILLLFMEKVKNYAGHIPGKLFEYMASGNYIIGIAPEEGEAARILKENNGGEICLNPEEIKKALRLAHDRWKRGELRGANPESLKNYTREHLTEILSRVFEEAK